MLRGTKVGLRARYEEDVPILHAELYEDVLTRARADGRPWRPIPPSSPESPHVLRESRDDTALFSVVALEDDSLVGEALLWGIDTHNRTAHIGLSLRPVCRGHGYGADSVRVLCWYGFGLRGLHRLQIETLAGNTAMIRAAERAGFALEGTLRRAAWVDGDFEDEVIYGLLAPDWVSPG